MKTAKKVRYIGIDFGTSTSVISYMDYERSDDGSLKPSYEEPLPVKFDESYSTVPTVVQVPGKQYNPIKKEYVELTDMSFGRDAASKLSSHPDLVRQNFKMDLMSEDEEKRNEARELLSAFFKMLYETYKEQRRFSSGEAPEEHTYVSYPAKWNEENSRLMVEVTSKAGFPNVEGMDEPVAAMRYCLTTETEKIKELRSKGVFVEDTPLNILLIDMGAGTTDLVMYKFTPKGGNKSEAEVLATYPPAGNPATFGGSEIDEIISAYVKDYLDKNLYKQPLPYNKLKDICRTWKEKVISPELQNDKTIDDLPSDLIYVISYLMKDDAEDFTGLDRTKLGELLKGYMPVFTDMVNMVLEKSSIPGDDVDLVIVTGGHSQWYFVREILLGKWVPGLDGDAASTSGVILKKIINEPWRIVSTPYPQQVVSQGLAMAGKQMDYKKKPLPTEKPLNAVVDVLQQVYTKKSSELNEKSIIESDPLFSIKDFEGEITCISISNDGSMVAASSYNKDIKVYDIAKNELVSTMLANIGYNHEKIQFSHNGKYIVAGSRGRGISRKDEYVIKLWKVQEGSCKEYKTFFNGINIEAKGKIFSLSPAEDEMLLIKTDKIYRVTIPEYSELAVYKDLVSFLNTIWSVSYCPDGKSFMFGTDGSIFIYDLKGKRLHQLSCGFLDLFKDEIMSADGKTVYGLDGQKNVKVWSHPYTAAFKSLPNTLSITKNQIVDQAFTPSLDHYLFVKKSTGNNTYFIDTKKTPHAESIKQLVDVSAISISMNGKYLATGHNDGTVKVWKILQEGL